MSYVYPILLKKPLLFSTNCCYLKEKKISEGKKIYVLVMIWQNVVFVGSNQGSGEGLPICVLQTSVM